MNKPSGRFPRLKLIPFALASSLTLAMSPGAFAESMTFQQIVERSLEQNPNIQVGQAQIDQAQAAFEKAKKSKMPKVNLSLTGTVSNNPLNVFGMKLQQRQASFNDFGADEFFGNNYNTEPDSLNNPGVHTDFNTRIEVLVPVWNGGKIGYYQEQAQAMIRAARGGDEAIRQHLVFWDYKAYEAVHAARAYIDVAKQAKKTADEFVRTTQNLVDQGVIVRSELLSALVNQSNAEVSIAKAEQQEQMALDGLKTLMNMDFNEPLDVADHVEFVLEDKSAAELVEEAYKNNPELVAMREQIEAEQQKVKIAQAAEKPSFNVMVRQDWNDENLGLDASSYTVAGVASWTITDFGVTESDVNMARSGVSQKHAELEARKNKLRMEIFKAWRTLKVAERQVTTSSLAVDQATEAQELIKRRFENGVATVTEVLASQTQLDKANADLVSAEYEVNVQRAQLRLLTGTITIKWN